MCGLAGFIGPSGRDRMESSIESMVAKLDHRGPDDKGEWIDYDAGLALGLARLAVIDLSTAGHQPMVSKSGRWVIAFNGEIYNFQRLGKRLDSEGPPIEWRGHSDTEVILEAVERWGVEATVRELIGMFAIALLDRKERALHLVRDRLGVKPLYYGRCGSTLLFASELGAIRAHPDFSACIDPDSVDQYFRLGYVPDWDCIYKGFAKVQPGTILTFDRGSEGEPSVCVFWSARDVVTSPTVEDPQSEHDALEEVERLLRDSIELRMIADVPLGVFLSGGLDSSIVTAFMQELSGRPVSTFTIGFEESGYDESAHAAEVARLLGTSHEAFRLRTDEVFQVVPDLGTIWDEPFADSSQIPTVLVSRLARKHVTVALTGDGGDELFGGYVRHQFAATNWPRIARVPRVVRKSASALLESLPDRLVQPMLKSALRLFEKDPARPEEKLRKLIRVVGEADSMGVYARLISIWDDPPTVHRGGDRRPLIGASPPDLGSAAELMMYLDLVGYLPGDLLVKVDRASMSASLETREPLLDHRLVEVSMRLPLAMKIRDGRGKLPLRRILAKYLPQTSIERPKMGFALPLGIWMRGPLREWVEDQLGERRLSESGLLDPDPIRRTWVEHREGKRDWQHRIWSVLMLLEWLDRNQDKTATP